MQSVTPLLVHECKLTLLKISGQPSYSAMTPDSEDLRFEYREDDQLYVPIFTCDIPVGFNICK
jgi:hypothetical protein